MASNSSSMMVTLTPLGVPREYSCSGCLPTGSGFSCVGPDTGRLMLAKRPPFSLFCFQTGGGVYSDELDIGRSPERRGVAHAAILERAQRQEGMSRGCHI